MEQLGSFCTCADHDCPLNPVNHDMGCAPCIEKNLAADEVPSCIWNKISTRDERIAEDCDYTMRAFAEMYTKKYCGAKD